MVAGGRGLQPRAGEKGGSETGPSPVHRARSGSKHHLLVDATGIPLAWTVTGGNRNDGTQLVPLVERIPLVRGKVAGRVDGPTASPPTAATTTTSTGASSAPARIKPEIARRQTEHGSGLGRVRWVVERTFAWLHHYKRLLVRCDRRHEIHEAFLAVACCLVCFRRLQTSVNARSAERTDVL